MHIISAQAGLAVGSRGRAASGGAAGGEPLSPAELEADMLT